MNRIWIELDRPTSKEQAEEQCRLANNMLRRLAEKPEDMKEEFFYVEHKRQYGYGGTMGYYELPDRGHWLNLDYLGRDSK